MTTRCGYIAIVGRPNVGKSTLMNCLVGQKLCITSRKPQTTRHSILGIMTEGDEQFIFVDTPGIHQGQKKAMNKMMNQSAINSLRDVDLILFLVDRNVWKEEDERVLQIIEQSDTPCILVVNKVDRMDDKNQVLPVIEKMNTRYNFIGIVPISAKTGRGVEELKQLLPAYLSEGPHLFPEDQFTDRPVKFLCAELVREKIFRLCGQELPYSTSVDIESFKQEGNLITIHALILVDKASHKRMIIGDKGSKLKEIATSARKDMEKLLGEKVFLQCWCKVKEGWSDNERMLRQLGYDQ